MDSGLILDQTDNIKKDHRVSAVQIYMAHQEILVARECHSEISVAPVSVLKNRLISEKRITRNLSVGGGSLIDGRDWGSLSERFNAQPVIARLGPGLLPLSRPIALPPRYSRRPPTSGLQDSYMRELARGVAWSICWDKNGAVSSYAT